MPRAVWKGAISFGLVHVPVALYPASQEAGVDFDWVDKRSMDPVGYKRVNKRTGKEIERENIARGVKLDTGDYVVLSDEEIKAAFPKSTQLVEIETFVRASEISFLLLERPFYLEPIGKGERVYALLREAMMEAGVVGIARVVMHSKEHLAVLVPSASALILNTIRWATEIRPMDELNLPAQGRSGSNLKPAELKMAAQLIGDMTDSWKADQYVDKFATTITELVNKKAAAGHTEQITPLEDSPEIESSSNVVDLTELLAKSLARHNAGSGPAPVKARKVFKQSTKAAKPIRETVAKRPARKRA